MKVFYVLVVGFILSIAIQVAARPVPAGDGELHRDPYITVACRDNDECTPCDDVVLAADGLTEYRDKGVFIDRAIDSYMFWDHFKMPRDRVTAIAVVLYGSRGSADDVIRQVNDGCQEDKATQSVR